MELTPSDSTEVAVLFTPDFKQCLKALSKRYKRIKSDLQPTIDQLKAGIHEGDLIPDLGIRSDGKPYKIYKVRLANKDAQRGKSGGYRLIYDATDDNPVILVIVFSKSDRANISASEIKDILRRFATV